MSWSLRSFATPSIFPSRGHGPALSRSTRAVAGACAALAIACLLGPAAHGADESVFAAHSADGDQPIDFNRDIRPILTRNCTACHGGVKQAAGLSFVYEEPIQDVITPGDADDSYLIKRIVTEDAEYRMPPPEHGPPIPDNEVALLKRWINQGGEWGAHWAYEPPQRHEAPSVSTPDWLRQPIDSFVLNTLDQRGVRPADDERPERWLRRVTLDLIGLPPTPEQRRAFLRDLDRRGEEAYTAVVDRLLASPRFGERWASVWFDQVRYADSRGQGEDSPRDIWKYRDWVIDAFNRDLPYDVFSIKQLAGDLLPEPSIEDRLATAVHRLTHTNEEGGTDDEEFRVASVLDRVTTTWQTWQGTTIGCVQCHDHPYDPIAHDEFYRSTAYFNNTADCDLSDDWPTIDVPINQDEYAEASELDRQIGELRDSLWREKWQVAHHSAHWTPLRISRVRSSNATKVVVEKGDDFDQYHTVGTIANGPKITAYLPLAEAAGPVTGIAINALPLDPAKALPDAEVGFVMSRITVTLQTPGAKKPVEIDIAEVVPDEPLAHDDAQESLKDGKPGYGAYTRINHPRRVVLLPAEPLDAPAGSTLSIKVHYRIFDLAAFSLVARRGYFEVSSDPMLTSLTKDDSLRQRERRLEELQAKRAEIESIATPVLVERPDHLQRPSHVFIRGLFLTKDKQVRPGAPTSLYKGDEPLGDRLAFARWLMSDENPLAARVAVNRFWARMFGVGIVTTEEDFGSAGEPPTHPELLDNLAVRFRDDYAWSVKKLLREIALSRTYRQSSQIRPELQEEDPQNLFLARGPRHSLPAETLRDQMLAVSGLLSPKMHGPPVQPPLPPGVWRARRGSWKTPPVGDPDRYRRSVYTYVKRSVPFPAFAAFDAPSRDFCVPKRLRSNTPLQPLMLLNDRAFVECAHALADLMVDSSDQLHEQIATGFARTACRDPQADEVDQLADLYQSVAEVEGRDEAMQAVAAVLLNLDEVITK